MANFHTIVTHEGPHFDEILGIWLLRRFGEQVFPGIGNAKIEFWGTGGSTPDSRSAQEYEQEGILLIGIGAGRFDEHPAVNGERKEDECAATLIAEALGLKDEPAFEKILNFALNSDLKADNHPFNIASIAKAFFQQTSNPEKVIGWVIRGIEVKYQEQLQFFDVAREEFEKNAEIEEIPGPGRMLKMVSIVSDNSQMSKFARSIHGVNADIVIQKQPSGNVQIFTSAKSGLILYDVVQMLRLTEQELKGDIRTTDWKLLSAEGRVEGAEEWFFQIQGQMILNGSLTATQVPATKIPFDIIKGIVRIGVNPQRFEPKLANHCKLGACMTSLRNRCPWYNFGLKRCRQIRFKMKTR